MLPRIELPVRIYKLITANRASTSPKCGMALESCMREDARLFPSKNQTNPRHNALQTYEMRFSTSHYSQFTPSQERLRPIQPAAEAVRSKLLSIMSFVARTRIIQR